MLSYLPAIVSFALWALASWVFAGIRSLETDRTKNKRTLAAKYGADRTCRICLVLFSLAAAVPALFYGWAGLAASLVLVAFVINAAIYLPLASDQLASRFKRGWQTELQLGAWAAFWLLQIGLVGLLPSLNIRSYLTSALMVSALLATLELYLTIRNLAAFAPKISRTANLPLISILIPARDEALNISACLSSVEAMDYPNLEVIVLDDRSTDGTGELAGHFKNVKVLSGELPPPGWIGKNFACQQLADAAQGDWLLFLDADARLEPQAVARLLGQAEADRIDMIGMMPLSHNQTWNQKLLLPTNQFGLLALQPAWWLMARRSSYQPAFGAGFLIKTSFYREIGGHREVLASLEVAPALASLCVSHMGRYELVVAAGYLSVDQAETGRQMLSSQLRQLYPSLRYNLALSLAVVSVGLLTQVIPFVMWLVAIIIGASWFWLASVTIGLIWLSRLIIALRLKEAKWSILLHPLAMIIQLALLLGSVYLYEFRRVRWKGSRLPKAVEASS